MLSFFLVDTIYSIAALERALANYVTDPHNAVSGPFNPQSIPKISADQEITQPIRKTAASMVEETPVSLSSLAAAAASKSDEFTIDKHAANLAKVPELAKLGTLLVSSKPIALTEAETEYNVSLIKHIFPEHIVLQYDCRNTLNDQILEDVYVQTETDADDISEEVTVFLKEVSVFGIERGGNCRNQPRSHSSSTMTSRVPLSSTANPPIASHRARLPTCSSLSSRTAIPRPVRPIPKAIPTNTRFWAFYLFYLSH